MIEPAGPLHESSITVFVNPLAGGGRARGYLPGIRSVLDSSRVSAEFVLTESVKELESRVSSAIAQNHHVLLAMGGDGTFQALANAAFGADVVLGILPVGSGNDFAAALGLPRDPIKAAKALLRGKVRCIDLVRARCANGCERLYVGGGGIGLDAEAMRYANGVYRHLPGRFRYVAAALRALASYVPLNVTLEFSGVEDGSIQSKALLAAILNTPTYGAGVRVAPDAAIDDGVLDVVLMEDISLVEILKLLPRLMKSGELRTSRLQRWRARRACLSTDRSSMFHGDGEILGPMPVELEVVPKAVQVLAPEQATLS